MAHMPADHQPTPSELVVRHALHMELPEIAEDRLNDVAFRLMVELGEVLPTSVYLEYLKKERLSYVDNLQSQRLSI